MNYSTLVIKIKSTLDKLIAARTSLGYDYIVYGLLLMNDDRTRVTSITKALYIDIAAHYETSWTCVEKNIRNTVNAIWTPENNHMLEAIFGKTSIDRKPANKEFFEYLYDFVSLTTETSQAPADATSVLCPVCNNNCQVLESMLSFVSKQLQPNLEM